MSEGAMLKIYRNIKIVSIIFDTLICWSYPVFDAVAEFRILFIQSLYPGYKQPFFQLQIPLDQFGNSTVFMDSVKGSFQSSCAIRFS